MNITEEIRITLDEKAHYKLLVESSELSLKIRANLKRFDLATEKEIAEASEHLRIHSNNYERVRNYLNLLTRLASTQHELK